MLSLGIMQGRLTPTRGRGIQFFPFENWKNEFLVSEKIGLNEIEWIFDYESYEKNPLWSSDGISAVRETIRNTGVRVHSVCFDYFMRRPFYKCGNAGVRKENLEFAKHIIDAMSQIGAKLLEIPMVDDSSVRTAEEAKEATDFLHDILSIAEQADVLIGCETDMPVGKFREFLDKVGHERIRANYDSGNSSGLGYDHEDEIMSLSKYIANVHIKDRVFRGETKKLGTGSADFDKVFFSLKEIGYNRSIILQAARGVDGDEDEVVRMQVEFVKQYCYKYGLE